MRSLRSSEVEIMTRQAVFFNEDMIALHADLQQQGLTSQEFNDFVKDAFHDKVDDIKAKRLDLSKETIARLTYEAVAAETKRALAAKQ